MTSAMAACYDALTCAGACALLLLFGSRGSGTCVGSAAAVLPLCLAGCFWVQPTGGWGLLLGQVLPMLQIGAFFPSSNRRGARFGCTLFTMTLFCAILTFLARLAGFLSGQVWLGLTTQLLLLGLLALFCRRAQGVYLHLQDHIREGWPVLAAVSAGFYLLLLLLTLYPVPWWERTGCIPAVVVFCAVAALSYVAFYRAAVQLSRAWHSQQNERLMLEQLAYQRGQIEQQQVYYHMAYFDQMTGLQSRAAFEEFRQQLEEDPHRSEPVCCLVLDINDLKQTNDRCGHTMGDTLIRCTAQVMRAVLGREGELFRTGGDEFVAFFCGLPLERVKELAEELEAAFSTRENEQGPELSVSFGWDVLGPCETVQALLHTHRPADVHQQASLQRECSYREKAA